MLGKEERKFHAIETDQITFYWKLIAYVISYERQIILRTVVELSGF